MFSRHKKNTTDEQTDMKQIWFFVTALSDQYSLDVGLVPYKILCRPVFFSENTLKLSPPPQMLFFLQLAQTQLFTMVFVSLPV